MNSKIRRARRERERNALRKDKGCGREKWVVKNQEVKRLTREDKTRVWRENLRGIEERKDVAASWRVIGALSGGDRQETGRAII